MEFGSEQSSEHLNIRTYDRIVSTWVIIQVKLLVGTRFQKIRTSDCVRMVINRMKLWFGPGFRFKRRSDPPPLGIG